MYLEDTGNTFDHEVSSVIAFMSNITGMDCVEEYCHHQRYLLNQVFKRNLYIVLSFFISVAYQLLFCLFKVCFLKQS